MCSQGNASEGTAGRLHGGDGMELDLCGQGEFGYLEMDGYEEGILGRGPVNGPEGRKESL